MGFLSKIVNTFRSPAATKSIGGKTHVVIADHIKPEAKDIAELVPKMRDDEQVSFAEFTLKACIKRIDVFITTESQDARAIALADKLQALWTKSLDDFLEFIAYGRSAFEKINDYDGESNLRFPCKLDHLPFSLSSMELADGQFAGITVGKGDNKITLTPSESLWVALDTDALNPHGRSRFLGAPYRVWQRRQKVVGNGGLEDKFLSRFALRGGVAHVEPTVTDEKTGQQIDNLAATAEAYQMLLSGGLVIFPNTQTDEGDWANDITESASAMDPTPLTNTIENLDIRMLRAFGIPEKTVIDNGAGSWDLVSLQMLILWAVCEGLLQQMVDAYQAGVIDPAVSENFIAASGVEIKATFTKPSQQPDSVLAEIAKMLMTSGQLSPIVLSGGIDVRKILESTGIPVTADLESRLSVILQQLLTASPPPTDPAQTESDPATIPDPTATTADATNVAATALNGAQIASLLDVIGQITSKAIPVSAATQILYAAFPAVPKDQINGIIKPLLNFTPAPVSMANANDLGGVPSVPTRDQLTDAVTETLNELWDELLTAAEKKNDRVIEQICDQINALHAQAQIAANIIGRLMPIKPRLVSIPAGNNIKPIPLAKAMTNVLDVTGNQPPNVLPPIGDPAPADDGSPKWTFPFLDDAIKWLQAKQLVTSQELVKLTQQTRQNSFTAPGVNSHEVLQTIHQAVIDSVAAGETPQQFHARIADSTSLTRAQSATILRTSTKSAAIAGLDATAQKPAVNAAFPYAMLAVTHDGRTRDSHWDARGIVVKVGTPEYNVIRRLLEDYNCRCGLILLNEDQAKQRGISTYEDLPLSVRSQYS